MSGRNQIIKRIQAQTSTTEKLMKNSLGGGRVEGGYYLMFDAARTSIALVRSGCSSSLRSTGVREHFSFIPRETEFGILTVGSQLVFDHRFILIHS